jgi:hypothetical protein
MSPITMSESDEREDRFAAKDKSGSGTCDPYRLECSWAEIDATRARLAEVERENAVLRGLLVQYQCPYGEKSLGECSRGFPGCACADDMLACMVSGPDDPAAAAERLRASRDAALAHNAKLREALEECAEYFDQRADAEIAPDGQGFITNAAGVMYGVCKRALADTGAPGKGRTT